MVRNESFYGIVLADEHLSMRREIKKIIERQGSMAVIGEAGDGPELLELLEKIIPDLVILELSLPRLRCLEAARIIKRSHPTVKILILTMYCHREFLFSALKAGVDAYLLKDDAGELLHTAIKTIQGGKMFISPSLHEASFQYAQELKTASSNSFPNTAWEQVSKK